MARIRITQIRSGIDRPEVQKKTLKALGLKMYRTIEIEDTPQMKGMLNKVQHLIKVENI
jgi:large subunit ribosomal protein L30